MKRREFSFRRAGTLAVLVLATLLPACQPDGGQSPCRPGAAACQEWVIVLFNVDDTPAALAWLDQQELTVGRVLPDLKLVHVWLPRGDAGAAAVGSIRSQPWAQYVTDQASPRPSA